MSVTIQNSTEASAERKRALLAERLKKMASREEGVPLSFSQQRLWFLDQLQPGSALYNVASVANVRGALKQDLLEKAINSIVERHEALRTRFVEEGDAAVQVVDTHASIQLKKVDLASKTNGDADVDKHIKLEVTRPFDLAHDRLIRATLLRKAADEHVLIITMHHIISDEWSLKVFFSELSAAYSALVNGAPARLAELPIQYSDFAAWQRKWMRGEILEKQLSFWKNQLAGELHVTELPVDHPRKLTPEFKGNTVRRLLPRALVETLKRLADEEKASLFMVMLAAFKCLVARYTGRADIIIGAPIAGRNRVEAEGLIGFFVNTLPLRSNLAGNPSFREVLRRVRQMTLEVQNHQDLPLDRLVEELRPERSLTHMPFTNLMFTMQASMLERMEFGGITLEFVDVDSDAAKFDCTLVAQETSKGIVLKAEYDVALFERSTMEACLEHLQILIEGAAESPDTALYDLPLISASERTLLLETFNRTGAEYGSGKCIHEIFEEQVSRNPGALALQFGERRLTYAELNSRSNQLASFLRSLGVGPDVPVAICAGRSPELIVGILGILKAGGAYVPLDAGYPVERLQFMMQDSGAKVLLTEQGLLSELPGTKARILCLDSDWEVLAGGSRSNPVNIARPESLAYIMYTSGSTGAPKGVCVPHRAVNRLVINTNYISIKPGDRIAQVSNVSFDAATFEVWGALLNGGSLIEIGKDLALSPVEFSAEIEKQNISAIFLTTALFNQLANDVPRVFSSIKTVMFGGEACDVKSIRKVLEQGAPERLLHVYGPTENTTFSTWHHVEKVSPEATTVPIGRAISNTQLYVLDANMNLMPVGVPGELYVGGDGLARGYWNRPELTERAFVSSPFRRHPAGTRTLYRTGDLVRWLPEGVLEFVGRIDTQIKIRGFRVELGEIESALSKHTNVRECVVALQGSSPAGKRLVGYVVPEDGTQLNSSELRAFLKEKLPDYMVPGAFVTLKSLPLTPNGKVNRKALPAPDQGRPELERGYVAPRDGVESKLAEIWEAVLNVRPIGVEDKFFDLGGHSLLAVRLVNKIDKAFGRKLRLATIFQASTIEQLASILREDVGESSLTAKTSLVEIQAKGSKPPLFLVHGAGGGMFWGYVNLAKHLGPDQPVYGFRSRGLDGLEEPESIEELASIYVEDLRKFQPHGPYQLGGYCFGGNVAYEMARQLQEAGEKVSVLAAINASPANSKYMRIPWTPLWAARFAKNMVYWTKYFIAWNGSQRAEFFAWKLGVLKRRILKRNGSGAAAEVDPGNMVDLSSYTEDQKRVWEAHIRALVKYHPGAYTGKIHLLRSGGHPLWCSFEPDYGWGEICRGVEVMVVPGAHEKVLDEPCVADVASRLSKLLGTSAEAQEGFSLQSAAAAAGGAALAGIGMLAPELTEAVTAGASMLAAVAGPMTVGRSGKAVERGTLSAEDLEKLTAWNQTAKPFNTNTNFITQFTARVRQHPDSTAVKSVFGTLTYRELDDRSNRLAARLVSMGAGREMLIGVCLERSIDLIIALLAIWKTGAAYLPLDPQYPEERINYMLEDSKAGLLVTSTQYEQGFKSVRKLVIDDPEERRRAEALPPHFRIELPDSSALAYVIYTSGSTGKPKGVEITHRSLLNHNFGVISVYNLTQKDKVLQFSPISFDISVEEIFPTLLSGGTLVLRTEEVISSVPAFLRFIAEEGLTVLNLPTAYWHEMVEHLGEGVLPDSVRMVVIGGEKASDEAFKRWKKAVDTRRVQLVNSYGPTEATVTSTYYIPGEDAETLPIGKPLPNVQLVVLDANLARVPVGQPGELCIGGAGLGRGYLGRPELTAEKFIPHSFKDVQSKVLYRTGDVVRFREDGNLEFLGRLDHQVKIRGFRIELGEIESTLLGHAHVKDAAVLAREDKPGDKRLVAYIVPRNGEAPHVTQLLEYMRKRMPSYLVPSAFVTLPAFPLTPAGKVDRRALPAPGPTRPALDQEYVGPRTPLEMLLASIFAEVLGIDVVGVKDDFIDLGGHSLLVTQILSRIRESLKIELPLTDVFNHPTVEALCRRIEERSGGVLAVPFKTLPGVQMRDLTETQSRVWFLDQYAPKQSAQNIPLGVRLTGQVDEAALEWSLSELAARHEALRSVFPEEGGKPVQYICAPLPVHLKQVDLSSVAEDKREAEAMALCAQEGRRNYITYGLMLNPTLIRLSAREHILLIVLHEIVIDFESARTVLRELIELYDARVSCRAPELPQAASFQEIIDLRLAAEEQSGGSEAYWKNKLSGAPELLDLPADRIRVVDSGEEGARFCLELPQKVVHAIASSGLDEEAVFLATYITLLHRYTGRNDIVLGTTERIIAPPADRSAVANLDDYTPLRQDVSGDPGFGALVEEVRAALAEARVHRAYPFSKVISLLQPERSSTYTPVFQVLFNYTEEDTLEGCPGGLAFVPFEVDHEVAKFDLALRVSRRSKRYTLSLTYSCALYDRDRMERMASHFLTLLEAGLAKPAEKISLLPLMGEQERELVLDVWNRTERPYSSEKTLIRLFDEQARRTPKAEALVCGQRRISYHELADLSVRVAAKLRTLGVGTGEKVALCMERSVELVSAILGTFRTGAAYVPVDPEYPKDRIEFMLQDCKAAVLLTQRSLAAELPASGATVLCIEDIDWGGPVENTASWPAPRPGDLAYIIYTSGSTGKPKGVMIEHRNAVAFVHWAKDAFDSNELSGVLAATSICFDLSIFELFAPLCWGGRVILAANALELPSLPAAREVRLINTVPSAIRELIRIRAVPDSVATINLAGEPLATSLVNDIYAQTRVKRVCDLYGPTETTTYSTWSRREAGKPATIGKPLTNQQVYLLDQKLQPVPVGISGEVLIGGSGLARGYLNRPELTAEKFIQHPFIPGERLYRTGDLARWRPDGYLEYLGRIDHQVKVRGFRIELGEIETALRSHPAVANAVVVAYEAAPGEKALAGYVEARKETETSPQELQAHIGKRLPAYMVPGVVMILDIMPLTPNGKIDRKALPSPVAHRSQSTERVEASTQTERKLLEVWKSVLPMTDIGVNDDFFELGGHSLLAIRVVAGIRETMGIELPLFSLFDTPTIEALARQIDAGVWASGEVKDGIRVVPRNAPLPASFVQERLWFLDQLNPGSDAYNVPAAIRIRGNLDVSRLQRALDRVVERHEALRTTFELADSALVQRIAPELAIPIEVVELKPEADVAGPAPSPGVVDRVLDLHSRKPFDLAAGPLVRAVLIKVSETEHVLLFSMHHTVSDGWSLAVLFKELEAFYSSAPDAMAGLPALPVQYADYAQWQRESMAGESLQKELEFWKSTMKGAPGRLHFPQANMAARGAALAARQTLDFDEAFLKAMTKTAQERGTTPFGILMAALAITLSKWTGQEDLVIGTVVAGRGRRELENLIGCFMNFLPIRARVRKDSNGKEFLQEMRNMLLQAQSHQECPFEKIVEAINPERQGDSNPLYNVALLWQNFPHDLFHGDGLESSIVPVAPSAALLDMRFEAEQVGSDLTLICEYRAGFLDDATVGGMLSSLRKVLETLVAQPEIALSSLELDPALTSQPAAESRAVSTGKIAISGTFTTEPLKEALEYWSEELGLHYGVEFAPYNQVFQELLTPGSLLAGNKSGANVTLLRLEDWAGVKDGDLRDAKVQAAIERSLSEFVSGLKSFAASNATPHVIVLCPASNRVACMPEAVSYLAKLEEELAREISALAGAHLLRSGQVLEWYPVEKYNDPAAEELGHVPYTPMFYTALATAIARKIHALKRTPAKVIVLDCDHTLWSGVCGEDGCHGVRVEGPWKFLQEFMKAQISAGMLLALCSKNNPEDAEEVFAKRDDMPLKREDFAAVRLNWTAKSENIKSMAAELNLGLDSFVFVDDNPVECAEVEANCPDVLTLLLPEKPEEIPNFLKHCWVFDHAKLTAEDRKRAEMYRQNSERERLRKEASGLGDFIAGLDLNITIAPMTEANLPRVAQLTQRTNQFNFTTVRRTEPEVKSLATTHEILTVTVTDRFGDYGLVGVVIYKCTNDVLDVDTFLLSCRVLGRGVEHKILSQLGEIARERKLNWVDLHYAPSAKNMPALNFLEGTAGAFKQHTANGGLRFRLPAGFASEVTFDVRAGVAPEPAGEDRKVGTADNERPAKFKACRTIATKLNNAARIHRKVESKHPGSNSAPREIGAVAETPMEKTLTEMWARLLHRTDIGVTDNFFDVGGHSLLAVRLFAEIERTTGRKFPLVTIFQASTIRELAVLLQREKQQKPSGPEALLVPIQPQGNEAPLFLVHGAGGDVLWGYANLAAHLGKDRPVYGIKSRGQVGLAECATISEMAACYVEAVRTRQPHGPYHLGGYCFGGNVAYEMARLLRAAGEEVALVALLDSSPSNIGYEDAKWTSPTFAARFLRNTYYWLQDFAQQPFREQMRFVSRKGRVLGRKLREKFAGSRKGKFDLEEIIDLGHFPEHELKLWQTHLQALVDHIEQPYDGEVTLFRTRGQPVICSFEDDFCWGKVVRKGVKLIRIPGSHENIFMEPNVKTLATELAKSIAPAREAEMNDGPEVARV